MAVPRHCRRWRAVEAGAAVFKTMCMLATSDRGRRGEDEDEPSVSKHIGVIINDVSAQSTSQRYKPYAAACLSHVYKGTRMHAAGPFCRCAPCACPATFALTASGHSTTLRLQQWHHAPGQRPPQL